MNSTDDLGIAFLKYLAENTSSAGGAYVDIKPFLREFMERTGIDRKSVKDVIWEMTKEGKYVGSSYHTLIVCFDSDHVDIMGDEKAELLYNLTWKGKAFYLEHIAKQRDGILSHRERIGFYVVAGLTVVSTIATVWQLILALTDVAYCGH